MRLLILGGTRFLGRHLAEAALAADHELTLLHRGRSGAELFPEAQHLIADRDGDLAALVAAGKHQGWDAAIDTSAYVPRHVRTLAAALAGRVGCYHLVSSISVYADFESPGRDEDAATATLEDPDAATLSGATYGALKRACEETALQAFGRRHTLIARPGLLVGPHDPTGRFAWWVQRLQRGTEVLVPGPREAPLQFIDARDAAAWLLRQAEGGSSGVFNLTGPVQPLTMGVFFERAARCLAAHSRLRWADGDWLQAEGVTPWTELPLWVPRASSGMHAVNIERAVAAGLVCRPLEDTLADTAAWLASDPPAPAQGPMPRPAIGLAPDREAALLARLPSVS